MKLLKKFLLIISFVLLLSNLAFAKTPEVDNMDLYNLLKTPREELEIYFNDLINIGILPLGIADYEVVVNDNKDTAGIFIGTLTNYLGEIEIKSGQVMCFRLNCFLKNGIKEIKCVLTRDNEVEQVLYSQNFDNSENVHCQLGAVAKIALFGKENQNKSIYVLKAAVKDGKGKETIIKPIKIIVKGYDNRLKKGILLIKNKIYSIQDKDNKKN